MMKIITLILLVLLALPTDAQPKRKAKNRPHLTVEQKRALKKKAAQFVEENTVSVSIHTETTYESYEPTEPIILSAGRVVGPQRRLVMLFNWQNNPDNKPFTKAYIEDLWGRQINEWYKTMSYGMSTLTVDVVDWFTVPVPDTDCTTDTKPYIHANALANGFNPDDYPDKVYIYPTGGCHGITGVTSSSIASDQTVYTSVFLGGNGANFGVSLHEYGHSLGFGHSNMLSCGTVAYGDNCTHVEYGDVYCVMGKHWALGAINAGHREFASWLNPTLVLMGGTYGLSALQSGGALKIPKTYTVGSTIVPGAYVVEYRPSQGVFVRLMPDYVYFKQVAKEHMYGTQLLDMTPGTATGHWLPIGATFTDSGLRMNLTVESANTSIAMVRVNFADETPDTEPPVISIMSPVDGGVLSGITSALAIASDNVGVSSVAFFSGTLQVGPTLYVPPWQIVVDTRAYANGTYPVRARARDGAGNEGWSPTINVTISNPVVPPDTVGPTITITSPTNLQLSSKGATTFSANFSDPSGVNASGINLDDVPIANCSGTTTCSVNKKVGFGTHTVTYWATDKRGNLSTKTIIVRK
jgi:hypothetical protein